MKPRAERICTNIIGCGVTLTSLAAISTIALVNPYDVATASWLEPYRWLSSWTVRVALVGGFVSVLMILLMEFLQRDKSFVQLTSSEGDHEKTRTAAS